MALLGLAGCIEYDEEITLAADGSGTVRIHYSMREQLVEMMEAETHEPAGSEQASDVQFDPERIRAQFADVEGVQVTHLEVESRDQRRHVDLALSFARPECLAETRFGSFRPTQGSFELSRRESGGFLYRRALVANRDAEIEGQQVPPEQLEEQLRQITQMFGEPRIRFAIVFPAALDDTNAADRSDARAAWSFVGFRSMEDDQTLTATGR